MSVKKTNIEKAVEVEPIDNSESKEEKVAKITSKHTLISGVVIAIISAILSPILLELIKKQPDSQNKPDGREIQYFDTAVAESNEQFTDKEIKLIELKESISVALQNIDDEQSKLKLNELKLYLEDEIRTIRESRKSFNQLAVLSMDALKNGERASAAALRKEANVEAKTANDAGLMRNVNLRVEKDSWSKMLPDWMNKETRMGMLKDAYEMLPNESVPSIRGINDADPKKSINEITETYAENKTDEWVEAVKENLKRDDRTSPTALRKSALALKLKQLEVDLENKIAASDIRGINDSDPKIIMDEITETHAENEANKSVEASTDLTPLAVAP